MNVKTTLNSNYIYTLSKLYNQLNKYNDSKNANKLLDLVDKFQTEEFTVGFSGHFSAGKSTMINTLLEEEILPSSPIPTSANLVKVKSGKGFVRVFFNEEEPIEYKEPYDLEKIKEYCKDGDSIKGIEINKSDSTLPTDVAILDTPGIDSSNDADQLMTESALHLVDALFYVMDYNHVQSEVNLSFLSEMQKRQKPIYIVVNQIDKHQESEISFPNFKKSVQTALGNWGITPIEIYYTSLKKHNHPYNQFNHLKDTLHQLFNNKREAIHKTIKDSAHVIIEDHLTAYKRDQQEKIDELYNTFESKYDTPENVENIESKLEELKNKPDASRKDMLESIQSTLKNAYIMPHEIREKARLVIEAYQSNFKVGLLFSKKKTEEERELRLQDFYESLMDKVIANMEWPIRNTLVKLAKSYDITNENLLNELQSLTISYEPSRLIELIKSGAGAGGDYLLVYTNDVANDLKNVYKKQAEVHWDKVINHIKEDTSLILQQKEEERMVYESFKDMNTQIQNIEKSINQRDSELHSLLEEQVKPDKEYEEATAALLNREASIRSITEVEAQLQDTTDTQVTIVEEPTKDKKTSVPSEEIISRLDQTIHLIDSFRGFQSIKRDLFQKKDRLKTRHFTVALFGAFSAGKSSFANALLGDKVLPVSPNPTTATINKISPPSDKFSHGTVVVKLKTAAQLVEDIKLALKEIPNQQQSFHDIVSWLRQDPEHIKDKAVDQKRLSFLQAVVEGYGAMENQIGETIEIGLQEFAEYVSMESLSCYVEWMELYYDCPFTRQGITLVDTPGADSVNARHTDVSFEYIKQSDAILFVTYYNHAFSRADRDFLLQLGRVKDAFSLDKMFFIINASDLAHDKEELSLVTNYVGEQLTKYGIRQPNLFPVSSLMAMEERVAGEDTKVETFLDDSGINDFEFDFFTFIKEDLTEIITKSALYDMDRARETLHQYIKSASLDREEKKNKQLEYEEKKDKLISLIQDFTTKRYLQTIDQKIEKQTYYVQERLFLRFTDFFKESFNPSVINGSGREAKEQLQEAYEQFVQHLSNELVNELKAVSVRIEYFLNQIAGEWNEDLKEKCKQVGNFTSLPNVDTLEAETPEFQEPFEEEDNQKLSQPLKMFKNTKAFFEGNEKEEMKNKLQNVFEPIVQSYIEYNQQFLQSYYQPLWGKMVSTHKQKIKENVSEYFDGAIYSLTDDSDIDQLNEAYQKIAEFTR